MATGVPVETIRTWERRYGFPESQRNEAGHRIYDLDTIEHLRLITAILAQGYRPSQLEGRDTEELEALLAKTTGGEEAKEGKEEKEEEPPCRQWLDDWTESVGDLERNRFEGYLRGDFSRMNALEFMSQRLQPFLVELGRAWAEGRLSVLHEHFASECIRDFLVAAWRPLSDMARGPKVVLATFSGEQHCLGLHMAALAVSMADKRVVFLGSNTPVEDIAMAADQSGAAAIAMSISQYANTAASVSFLGRLRGLVSEEVPILIGGGGAPSDIAGVESFAGLESFYERMEEGL